MRSIYVCLALALLGACAASVSEEKAAITEVVKFARGGASLAVEPIVVRTEFGIADWAADAGGGRALLKKERGQWKVVVVAGDELRDPTFLQQAGVPEKEAKALVNVLMTSERKVPEARLAMLDKFERR